MLEWSFQIIRAGNQYPRSGVYSVNAKKNAIAAMGI
jgi:hypothetical protein